MDYTKGPHLSQGHLKEEEMKLCNELLLQGLASNLSRPANSSSTRQCFHFMAHSYADFHKNPAAGYEEQCPCHHGWTPVVGITSMEGEVICLAYVIFASGKTTKSSLETVITAALLHWCDKRLTS